MECFWLKSGYTEKCCMTNSKLWFLGCCLFQAMLMTSVWPQPIHLEHTCWTKDFCREVVLLPLVRPCPCPATRTASLRLLQCEGTGTQRDLGTGGREGKLNLQNSLNNSHIGLSDMILGECGFGAPTCGGRDYADIPCCLHHRVGKMGGTLAMGQSPRVPLPRPALFTFQI